MKVPFFNKKIYLSDVLWDGWCIASIIGIWPRFIEPNLIQTTKLTLKIKKLPPALAGLKVLQFSDIHLHAGIPDFFLNKLRKKIKVLAPDIIVFTGDFLCYSRLRDKVRLKKFLDSFEAPQGCYAIFGNHDYQKPVSINAMGEYDIIEHRSSLISKGFSRIFTTTQLAKKVTLAAKETGTHPELEELLKTTPFEVLHNTCKLLSIKGSHLNICGLGEYTLGRCLPEIAFKGYDNRYPGILLAHNPDSVPLLMQFPGDIILCGHTHGGQINLPWLWKKFTLLENMQFKQGLFHLDDKWIYVNKGVGSVMQFRWFAMPEITLITLEQASEI
jgi:uncharacterized protein